MRTRTTARGAFDIYVKNNKILLIICTSLLILGICTGSVYCVSLANGSVLSDSIGNFGLLSGERDSGAVFLSSLINSMQLALFIWLCGCTKLGVPIAPLIISLKGFACGFSVCALITSYGTAGFLAAGVGILPQMIIMFVIMEIFCVAAINQAIYASRTSDKLEKRRRFVSYCVFSSLIFIILALCSLFESYISPYLLIWALGL